MELASFRFSDGYTQSIPEPNTAAVFPSTSNADACATASMPKAKPLLMHNPASTSLYTNFFVVLRPYDVVFLVPTTAIPGSFSTSGFPYTTAQTEDRKSALIKWDRPGR